MINYNKSFKINTKASLHDKALKSCSTSLPGGDLVDGLPPAASHSQSIILYMLVGVIRGRCAASWPARKK